MLALIAVVSVVGAYDNGAPHSRMPPLGWSSWNALGSYDAATNTGGMPQHDYCDAAGIKATIDAFHDLGMYAVGYRHFHLDDCWSATARNASGFLRPDPLLFPKGMKDVVDYAHSKNLTFGLYLDAGTHTCHHGFSGSQDHWTQDANVVASWGVDWVKMDWCATHHADPAVVYPHMSSAMNATGRPMHFNLCNGGGCSAVSGKCPWDFGPAIAQSWRTAADHTWEWASTNATIAQRLAIPVSESGAPFAWNDMDMLQTGNYGQMSAPGGKHGWGTSMTAVEYRSEFSMWAILASPLGVTTPLLNCSATDQIHGNFTPGKCRASLTELQKEILLNADVIAINQDVTPGGRLLSRGVDKGNRTMLVGRSLSGGDLALALYNPTDSEAAAAVDFAGHLGWPVGTSAAIRDLWSHVDLGAFSGRFPKTGTVTVGAHATVVLRLTRTAGSAGGS